MEQYSIPFYQKSSFKWYMNLLFLFCTLFSAAGAIFFFVIIMKDDFIMGIFGGLFMLMLSLFFAYMFIAVGILKKFHIEMTSEYINVCLPFKSKIVYWREIYEAQVYELNNNTMIAILLEKDRKKKSKRTISNNVNSLFGAPACSFQIPLRLFKDIDAQKLLLTIGEQLNKVDIKYEINSEDYEEHDNSLIKAIITSSLFCIITSAIYGFTIYKIEVNYVVIPVFGCFLIISGFNKYYLEKSFNLTIRLWLGLICLMQVPAAIIGVIIISERYSITVNNILSVTQEYFEYLVHNPLKQVPVIIVAIICFAIGAFRGRTNKEKGKLDIQQ
jgi:hypothetical protein